MNLILYLTKISLKTWAYLLILILTISFFISVGDPLSFTGDEPRYVYYAHSYANEGIFVGNLENWYEYLKESGQSPIDPNNGSTKPGHSIVIPFIISPFTKILKLNELRILSSITGILGGMLLFFLIKKLTFSHKIALFISIICTITIPVLPYFETLFSDIWLFTGVTAASLLLVFSKQRIQKSKFNFLIIVPSFFFFLIFLHIRLLPVSAVFSAFFYLYIFKSNFKIQKKFLVHSIFFLILVLVGFSIYQLSIFGSLTGSASSPYTPSLIGIFERLAIQLFEMRHGLLVYSPFYLFSFIGFILAVSNKKEFALEFLFALIGMILVFIWGAASESFPGRFWVATIPLLAIGLAYWFILPKRWFTWIPFWIFLFLGLINTYIYIHHTNAFLENRIFSYTYDLLFSDFNLFNFSAFLPWDEFGIVDALMNKSHIIALWMLIISLVFIATIIISLSKSKVLSIFGILINLSLIFFLMAFMYVKPLGKSEFTANPYIENNYQVLVITLSTPTNLSVVRFGEPRYYWPTPIYPSHLWIECSFDGVNYIEKFQVRATPTIAIQCNFPVKTLRITSNTSDTRLFYSHSLELYKKPRLARIAHSISKLF